MESILGKSILSGGILILIYYATALAGLRLGALNEFAALIWAPSGIALGAVVETATSAKDGLKEIRDFKPSVIVSDIGMPGEDGYDFIRQVRRLNPDEGGNTPAAALTAYTREEERKRALDAGFEMHIAKPITNQQLLLTVAELAGQVRI